MNSLRYKNQVSGRHHINRSYFESNIRSDCINPLLDLHMVHNKGIMIDYRILLPKFYTNQRRHGVIIRV